jgi:hypothetical protein
MTKQELIVACYRSGHINERQWQEHMQEATKLRDAWHDEIDPDNSGWSPIG